MLALDLTVENDRLRTETQQLAINIKDKARKHQQTQELYDRLKRKQMTAATQFAAQSAANDSIEDMNWNAQGEHRSNDLTHDHSVAGIPRRFTRSGNSVNQSLGGMMPPPPGPCQGPQGLMPLHEARNYILTMHCRWHCANTKSYATWPSSCTRFFPPSKCVEQFTTIAADSAATPTSQSYQPEWKCC